MRFLRTLTYDASADDVHAMLTDPAFREKVCATGGALRHQVSVTGTGSDTQVVVEQAQPADGIPSFAKKFVGEEIQIVQKEVWSGPTGASFDVNIPGKPGQLLGALTLAQSGSESGSGSTTTESIEGDLKVNIPLVGGKLEKLIGELLGDALKHEERVGRAWLRGEH